MATTAEQRRERLLALVKTLPEVEITGEVHLGFRVARKTFAYYLVNHHGDGRIGLCAKAYPGDQQFLLKLDPNQFYVPAYLGARGWVGLRLDLAEVDWGHADKLLSDAYRQTAPKRLSAQLPAVKRDRS